MPVLRRADRLRRSLVPSLLGARRTNEALANAGDRAVRNGEGLSARSRHGLPQEDLMLALTSGRDFLAVKGVIEALVAALNRQGANLGSADAAGTARRCPLLRAVARRARRRASNCWAIWAKSARRG